MNRVVPTNETCARLLAELERANALSPSLEEHVGACAACRQEVELRNRLRTRLKGAMNKVETPPFLEARIRANLRGTSVNRQWQMRWAAVAAAVMVCLAATLAYQLGHLRWTAGTQESYIASVSNQVATLMRVGLGDHIHCAVFRKIPAAAPSMETLNRDLGPQYAGLLPALAKHLPAGFQVVIAHQCRYHNRRFVHLTAKSDAGLISLVLARKESGESFETEGLLPALTQSGIPFYRTGAQRFQIAAFETTEHLVYMVSDLSKEENTNLMLAVAGEIGNVLTRLQG